MTDDIKNGDEVFVMDEAVMVGCAYFRKLIPRYYAEFVDGKHYCWANGWASHTTQEKKHWEIVKKANNSGMNDKRMGKNWINNILDNAVQEVSSWPSWMQEGQVRVHEAIKNAPEQSTSTPREQNSGSECKCQPS